MRKIKQFLKQGGYSAPEMLVGSMVAASLAVTALTGFTQVNSRQDINRAASQLSELQTGVHEWVGAGNSIRNVSTEALISGGHAPKSMLEYDANDVLRPKVLSNPLGGSTVIEGANSEPKYRYAIAYTHLDTKACKRVVQKAYSAFIATSVCSDSNNNLGCGSILKTGNVANWDRGSGRSVLVAAELKTQCEARDSNTVTFYD